MQPEPTHIICAIRGGPESRATVTRAIELTLATGAHLTFFHIMDAEFLQHATIGPLSVVYDELKEMGTFTMLILCDRARRRGVADVDFIVREGNIRKHLRQLAIETRAQVLVMGSPTRSPTRNVFQFGEIDQFAAQLADEGDVHVIVAPAENA